MIKRNGLEINEGYTQANRLIMLIHGFLCVFGIVGNLITIRVFSRKSLKSHSYSFYSRVLATCDTALLSHLLIYVVKDYLDEDGLIVSPYFCSFRFYMSYVMGTTSLWLLVLISVDRLLKIAYPNRFGIFRKRAFQWTLILLTIIYSFIANINIVLHFKYETVQDEELSMMPKPICFLPPDDQNKQSWIMLSNFVVVNLFINNILGFKMIGIVIRSRRKAKQIGRNNNKSQTVSKDVKFAITSIGLNITSLFARMPIAIGILLSNYLNLDPDFAQLSFKVCLAIATFDHSLTLFINMFLNSIFYREFIIMFQKQ